MIVSMASRDSRWVRSSAKRFSAAPGIDKMVKACPVDPFLFNEIEYPVKIGVIAPGQGKAEPDPLSDSAAVLEPLHGPGESALDAPEFIVDLLHPVKADPDIDHARVLVCFARRRGRSACRSWK